MGGRGGPFTALFGLFILSFELCLKLLFYALVGVGFVIKWTVIGVRALWRIHKRRQAVRSEQQETAAEYEPPTLVISPVTKRKED